MHNNNYVSCPGKNSNYECPVCGLKAIVRDLLLLLVILFLLLIKSILSCHKNYSGGVADGLKATVRSFTF